ncbi:hypothetical protein CONLIGDRAFT_674551 [Coniochaeta ligniaria NRRL 30616]|uniref:Chromo domain-containing protein n=1 Tax=Coniochaeta ligniaria NRRL 30616 TaxID=1408157 RepID=A0A1J7I6V7_9PEZI|nr:hypothetical protein CONLIGDRAFT_674551 [Coniochaeta ligniaria NRRL 30616]
MSSPASPAAATDNAQDASDNNTNTSSPPPLEVLLNLIRTSSLPSVTNATTPASPDKDTSNPPPAAAAGGDDANDPTCITVRPPSSSGNQSPSSTPHNDDGTSPPSLPPSSTNHLTNLVFTLHQALYPVSHILTHRACRHNGTTHVTFKVLFEDGSKVWLSEKDLWETAPNPILDYYEAHGGGRSECLGLDDERERFVARGIVAQRDGEREVEYLVEWVGYPLDVEGEGATWWGEGVVRGRLGGEILEEWKAGRGV